MQLMESVYRHHASGKVVSERLVHSLSSGKYIVDGMAWGELDSEQLEKFIRLKPIFIDRRTREVVSKFRHETADDIIFSNQRISKENVLIQLPLHDGSTEVVYNWKDFTIIPECLVTDHGYHYKINLPLHHGFDMTKYKLVRQTRDPVYFANRETGEIYSSCQVVKMGSRYLILDFHGQVTELNESMIIVGEVFSSLTDIYTLGGQIIPKDKIQCLTGGYLVDQVRFYSLEDALVQTITNPEYYMKIDRVASVLWDERITATSIVTQENTTFKFNDRTTIICEREGVSRIEVGTDEFITTMIFDPTELTRPISRQLLELLRGLNRRNDTLVSTDSVRGMHEYVPESSKVVLVLNDPRYKSLFEEKFPGWSFSQSNEFLFEPTFFWAVGAPDDWEDLYGEPFKTRDLVYGFVPPANPTAIVFYSSEELIACFLLNEDFVDPKRKGERFNERQIKRLALLSKDQLLGLVIRELSTGQKRVMSRMKELSAQDGFKECLLSLLTIGMLMRGWSGQGEYPLKESETHQPVNQVQLSKKLLEYDSKWSPFNEIRLILRENEWRYSEESLGDRLKTVLGGSRVEACIRMTSSLFSRTAWYYLDMFFQERPFDISQLEKIV